MSSSEIEVGSSLVEWIEVIEYNDWEGEMWHHYFRFNEDHYRLLKGIIAERNGDDGTFNIRKVTLSWETAEYLINQDDGGYMLTHWFGELINVEGLKQVNNIYKGKLREYGEECSLIISIIDSMNPFRV